MGAGKTSVGRGVARSMGWRFVDMDGEIVAREGRAVEEIFAASGEDVFRGLERRLLTELSLGSRQVVSTGGGVPMDPRNREVMEASGLIVCLDAHAQTIARRIGIHGGADSRPARPMLDGPDRMARLKELKAGRQRGYSMAAWTVMTDRLSIAEAATEVVRAYHLLSRRPTSPPAREETAPAATVSAPGGDYPVWVGWGILEDLGGKLLQQAAPAAAYVVTDLGAQRHGRRAQFQLEASGIPAHLFVVPSGERSKSVETAQHLYDWLADRRAERGHLVLAVGGGMVGDLAGFVAATYLRGIPFAQVPTTTVAMIDSSVGGKVAVDLPKGKNLVGAFHPPRFVLADIELLKSLPRRELVSGWAEGIKHGLIMDEALLSGYEDSREAVLALDPETTTEVVRRSVAIKADVVSRDERETLGVRMLLNYGHTIGHALEAATGYQRYLHGEAVSIGMTGAAEISFRMGLLSEDEAARQTTLLEGYGLPVRAEGVAADALIAAMALDKKRSRSEQHWVLLDGIGEAVTRSDVPEEVVRTAVEGLLD